MNIKRINAADTLALRQRVLWPNKTKEFCRVDGDESATHYGIYEASELVGVASTYINGDSVRLRKFAVEHRCQGKGYGSQLLQYIINAERSKDVREFWCDARKTAIAFYQRFGMAVEGEEFYKADVAYFKMAVNL